MKMSDVKFNTRMTEGGPNIDETLTFIGAESITAIDHAVNNHDKLTADNAALVEALGSILNGQSKVVHLDRVKANEALEKAKGDVC